MAQVIPHKATVNFISSIGDNDTRLIFQIVNPEHRTITEMELDKEEAERLCKRFTEAVTRTWGFPTHDSN